VTRSADFDGGGRTVGFDFVDFLDLVVDAIFSGGLALGSNRSALRAKKFVLCSTSRNVYRDWTILEVEI